MMGNLIQNLGIGEAFVTALDEKGIPTPLVQTYLISPESRMDVLSSDEIDDLVNASDLAEKYKQRNRQRICLRNSDQENGNGKQKQNKK